MKNFIISLLGGVSMRTFNEYRILAKSVQESRMKADSEVNRLKVEIMGLTARTERAIKVIAANIGDVEPTDQKARKDYVAQAANFYESVLESKMLQMIAQVREQEDTIFADVPPGMSRVEYDYVLKGTSNAFRFLMDWGEQMKAEHASNINSENPNE